MARQLYETDCDLRREGQIASLLASYWKCSIVKLPMPYGLDFAAIRENELTAWIEAKRRFRELSQFATCFLSMQKVMAAKRLYEVTGLRCLFVIQFNDCLAFTDILLPGRRIELRGRTDRDGRDQEPVVVIPTGEFKVIGSMAPNPPVTDKIAEPLKCS